MQCTTNLFDSEYCVASHKPGHLLPTLSLVDNSSLQGHHGSSGRTYHSGYCGDSTPLQVENRQALRREVTLYLVFIGRHACADSRILMELEL